MGRVAPHAAPHPTRRRAGYAPEAHRREAERLRREVAEYSQENRSGIAGDAERRIKNELTGMGDFFPGIGVSAEGTAFIHGLRYEAGTVNRTRKKRSG